MNVVEEPEGFIAHESCATATRGSWLEDQEPGTPVAGSGVYLVVDDVDERHAGQSWG